MMMSSRSSHSLTSSSLAVAVDKATSELLFTPDWTMIIAICDSINSHHWQGRDAIKAVKRRLQHKNAKVQLHALTLLEAMVKNCGDHLHSQIAEKHVLGEMVKIVRKKGDFEVRNKILVLLDSWHEAFGGSSSRYPHYNWSYEELRRSGIKFPERSREAALMLTAPETRPSLAQSSSGHLLSTGSFRRLDETMATEIESLSLSSLESMRNVMDLVNEMVQAVNPGDRSALKDEVIVELVDRCRSNQKKLIQMLTTTADEEVLARGLELNDSMQSVLAKHDAITSGVSLPPSNPVISEQNRSNNAGQSSSERSLEVKLDASDSESVTSSSSSENETCKEKERDDFVQLAKRQAQMCVEESEEEALLLKDRTARETEDDQQARQCKELALSQEEVPTSTRKAEQDMIDLLSLTLSTTDLPPGPFTAHQTTHNTSSYVVPWAQSQPEYGSPSQTQPAVTQFQPQSQYSILSHFQSVTQQPQMQRQYSYEYPPPPWAGSQGSSHNNTMQQEPQQKGQLQYSNSFPSRVRSTEVSGNSSGREGTGSAQRPYVPPYRLFEDLNVFWDATGGRVKSTK